VGEAAYTPESGGPGSVTGTFTNCSQVPVSKRIQLDRGSDSGCYDFAPGQTRTETYRPQAVGYPGGARWVDCSAP